MRLQSTPAAPDAVMGLRSSQRQVTASPAQISATCYSSSAKSVMRVVSPPPQR
jgi:hypothetical protein